MGQRLSIEGIQARRHALGLTQAALAERLGVTANTVTRWERGELRPMHPALVARQLARLERSTRQHARGAPGSTGAPGGPAQCAQMLLARTAVIVWQTDATPTFRLLVRASFADHVARWLSDATLA